MFWIIRGSKPGRKERFLLGLQTKLCSGLYGVRNPVGKKGFLLGLQIKLCSGLYGVRNPVGKKGFYWVYRLSYVLDYTGFETR